MNWFRILRSGNGVDLNKLPLAIIITLGLLLLAPFRLVADFFRRKAIKSAHLLEQPIFIVGHWRSGTTHLHNLMASSGRFGGVYTFDAFFPYFSLWIRNRKSFLHNMLKRLSFNRPQDNMKWDINEPEEEEFAVANTSPYSFFHGWIFKKRFRAYFQKYILFNDVSGKEIAQWKKVYNEILLQSSICSNGKPLLLKNPYNTARIKMLFSMYPDSRFIYIYRDPVKVYSSIMHMFDKISYIELQSISDEEMMQDVFFVYNSMHERFYQDVKQLPDGYCSFIRYEDLVKEPLSVMSKVYKEIGIDGFEADSKRMLEYLKSVKNYKKNEFNLGEDDRKRIEKEWGKYIRLMGYEKNDLTKEGVH